MKITCPTCRGSTTWEENRWKPFCSERCKLIDLGKWATGEYVIEGKKVDKSGEEIDNK